VQLDDVEVRTPAAVRVVGPARIRSIRRVLVITGNSGSGKTTLLRSRRNCGRSPPGTLRSPQTTPLFPVAVAVCAAG